MVAGSSSESLPPGFTEKVKYKNGRKTRYYYNASTGAKYYSKKELIRSTADNGLLDTPQKQNVDNVGGLCSKENADSMLGSTNDTSKVLPEGWIIEEERRQSGSSKESSYKVYEHLSSGRKFYSRASVIHYLNTLGHNISAVVQNEDIMDCSMEDSELPGTPRITNVDDDNVLSSDKKIDALVVKENDTPQWLPEGWTMEERTRQNGPTKGTTYKVYIESSSGKKFYSRPAVTQYLNTVGHSGANIVQTENAIGGGTADDQLLGTPQRTKVSVKVNNTSLWLPEGWVVEEKTRQNGSAKGSTYKVYIDSSSGKRFYSRNAVTQYLNTIDHGRPAALQNEDGIGGGTANNQYMQTTDGDDNALSTNKFVGVSVENDDSSQWLPDGWEVEEKTRQSGSGKGSTYKVYIDWSTGSKFYSKAAVIRYLNTINHANSMTEQKNYEQTESSVKSCPDVSPQGISKTSSGHASGKKNQSNLKMITSEVTAANDLPPGWTKEIRTSKSGSKIRRDLFYSDPISGYVFRSKLDALRYVETNDIRSCICRPFKRDSDDLKLIDNDIPSSNASDKNSSENKGQLFLEGESYGGEISGTKSQAKSKAKVLKQAEGNNNVLNNETPITNRLATKRQLSSGGTRKQTSGSQITSTKSKRRQESELPSRTSKRLFDTPSLNTADIEAENASEKPHMEKPEDESDSKKSPESQHGIDLGDSWSDPVEFALKTVCGEIPAEDDLPFPEGFNKPLDGYSKPVDQSNEPINFKTEFARSTEPLRRHGALALLQSSPTFSAASNVNFNSQTSAEGGKDSQPNSNP